MLISDSHRWSRKGHRGVPSRTQGAVVLGSVVLGSALPKTSKQQITELFFWQKVEIATGLYCSLKWMANNPTIRIKSKDKRQTYSFFTTKAPAWASRHSKIISFWTYGLIGNFISTHPKWGTHPLKVMSPGTSVQQVDLFNTFNGVYRISLDLLPAILDCWMINFWPSEYSLHPSSQIVISVLAMFHLRQCHHKGGKEFLIIFFICKRNPLIKVGYKKFPAWPCRSL